MKPVHWKTIFQVLIVGSAVRKVSSQFEPLPQKPESCHRPPAFMYRQCCIFPPFFTRDVAKGCGGRFAIVQNDKAQQFNVTIMIRLADRDELHWKCVLKRYKMLSPDEMLLEDKYFAHLDKWGELNPKFANIIQEAKTECKLRLVADFPLEMTLFYKLNGCVRNYVKVNCPDYIPTNECDELKKFYEVCGKFFV